MSKSVRIVYKRDDGKWVNKKTDSDRGGIQSKDLNLNQELLKSSGEDLVTKGLDGKIQVRKLFRSRKFYST